MAVNAWSQDSLTHALQQGAAPLMVLNPDGSVLMHGALVATYFSGLVKPGAEMASTQPCASNGNESPAPTATKPKPNHYDAAFQQNLARGRTWASKARRIIRATGCERYEAMQTIASELGVPVTDVRLLVELSNKSVRPRGKAIRQAILWKWHCEGSSHRASADRFPFPLHEKTVAADIREILKQQHGGDRNVR